MVLIAPFARVSRSTNRSTPHQGDSRMPTTESYRRLGLRCQGYGRRATWSIWTTRRSSSIVQKTRYRPARRRRRSGDPYGNGSGGLRNRAIADRLEIAEATIEFHLRNLFRKFGAETRTDLVCRARREGWVA